MFYDFIIVNIKEYLDSVEYSLFTCISKKTYTLYSKRLFLNSYYSDIYLTDSEFYKYVNETVFNTNTQVGLSLFLYDTNLLINDNTHPDPVYSMKFDNINVYSLELNTQYFILLNPFRNITYLKLEYCSEICILPIFYNLKEAVLHCCDKLIDVGSLKTVNNIVISKCPYVKYLNDLTNVENIIISYCERINNIVGLDKVKEVLLHNLQCDITSLKSNLLTIINCDILNFRHIYNSKNLIVIDTIRYDLLMAKHSYFIFSNLRYL